jgi:hypothetical protein
MNILPESTDWSLSLSGFADMDTAFEISVTSCEYVDEVLVCQTSNSQDSEKTDAEQGDASEPTDLLSLDERQFLSEFFFPIADALADEEMESWVVPSQYDPMEIAEFFEEPFHGDDQFVIIDDLMPDWEMMPDWESQMYHYDGYVDDADMSYYGYDDFEQAAIPLYPRLVKKWRKVPCHQLYHANDPVLLFINEDDVEPLVDGGMCGMVSSALIIAFMLLFCCMVQKINCMLQKVKEKKYKNQFSKEKTQRLLVEKEVGEAGNYVPPSLKVAVKKESETTAGEPHIIFI